jgi:alpha-mannosidase
MTTQAAHKRNMRESSIEALDAEKWASLAWVLAGQAYPSNDLTEDWKKILFNQFHDLAAGSGIGVIYKDAQKDYDVVRWSTNEISSGALQTVAERINTGVETDVKKADAVPVVVFNPLGWQRSGAVTVKLQLPGASASGIHVEDASTGKVEGSEVVSFDSATGVTQARIYVHDIPALGYKVYRVSPEAANGEKFHAAQAHEAGDNLVVENANLRVIVNKQSGCITSVSDLRSGFEALGKGACGNQLQFFKDNPKDYDAWNIDPGTLDVSPATIKSADSVEIVGADSPTPGIRVASHWQSSKFVQTIRILPGADSADVENDIDWHEAHILLKASFPVSATSPFATYDIPYGEIDRTTTRNNSWEKAQFEVPAQYWADLGTSAHGLSLINDSKFGYDAVGNQLRLTLLRSPKWPDPDADMGHQHFHYAIYPHAGTWKDAMTVRHGWEYNYPLTAIVTTAHAGSLPAEHSFASVGPENVVLTAIKKAEDAKGLVIRCYEWAGKDSTAEFHVPAGATGATVVNMMETPQGDPLTVAGDVVKAPIHPYEILTIRVDYPNGGPKE